jgi:hypothetical protein
MGSDPRRKDRVAPHVATGILPVETACHFSCDLGRFTTSLPPECR